jgi:hypothetical protein
MALDATVVVVTVLGCVFFLVVVIVAFVKVGGSTGSMHSLWCDVTPLLFLSVSYPQL